MRKYNKCKTPRCTYPGITEAEEYCAKCMRKMGIPEEDISMLENLQEAWEALDNEYADRKRWGVANLSGNGSGLA